MLEVMYTVQYR